MAVDIEKLRTAVKDFRFQGKIHRNNENCTSVSEVNHLVESIAHALDKFVDELEASQEKDT